jgi:hypothetical protein
VVDHQGKGGGTESLGDDSEPVHCGGGDGKAVEELWVLVGLDVRGRDDYANGSSCGFIF